MVDIGGIYYSGVQHFTSEKPSTGPTSTVPPGSSGGFKWDEKGPPGNPPTSSTVRIASPTVTDNDVVNSSSSQQITSSTSSSTVPTSSSSSTVSGNSTTSSSAPPPKSSECEQKTHHHKTGSSDKQNQPTTQTTTAVATSSSTSEAPTTATATATPSTSNSNPPPTETETTSSNTTSSYAPGQTGPTDSHRVYSSGYMSNKPPGYSEAPIDEIYVYNGKDWVLSSTPPSLDFSPEEDTIFDSSGHIIGGADEEENPPDHALSRRPDKTYQPAPSGSHYRYDKPNNSWILEGDGGSPIPMTDPTDKAYYIYDSNGVQVLAVGIPSSSNQPTTQTTTAVATSSSTSEAPTTATATATPSTSNSNQPPTTTETTSSDSTSTSSYALGQTGPTDSYRTYESGYMMKKPPGYSDAPTSEIYVYNGKDWVLTSASGPVTYPDVDGDDVFDSNGVIIGGKYHEQIPPDHALSRQPDRTYLRAPSGSHYRYDKANNSWTLEGDGGSPIPTTDVAYQSYVVYDSNGKEITAYN
jgi:hypothetical protein